VNRDHYYFDSHGSLRRRQPKLPPGMSARQGKKLVKLRRRWDRNNFPWFGATKVGDSRIPLPQ
jgi:hypothetical protein